MWTLTALVAQHRDLHWGQVLIKDDPSQRGGVTATIIDLGLSRMKDVDGRIYHTAFEPEIFEGQGESYTHILGTFKLKSVTPLGDYQFDVYRLMRDTHGSDWEDFKPLTNVMVSKTLTPAPESQLIHAGVPVATLPGSQDVET